MSRLAGIFVAVAVLLLVACEGKEPLYQEQGYVFGTLVEISVYGESEQTARQAVSEVMLEFQRLHNMLHAWQPSELSDLNAAFARKKSAAISAELAAILQDAKMLSQQSQGSFNPAIGGLVQLWGFHADEFKSVLPDQKQIAQWVSANPRMSDIAIVDGRAQSKNKFVQVDLGGYAKGYALDRATELMRRHGIRNALINIGGNVLAMGRHGKRAWRVGIQHPRKPGALATMELRDGEAIGTSGDYQRYFMVGNMRYCHLIDPNSGYPMQGIQSVTVLIKPLAIRLGEQTTPAKSLVMTRGSRAGVLSDVASKPLFIAGVRGWRGAASRMNVSEAMLVDGQGNVHLTSELQKRLEFTDKNLRPQVEP
jgi:FAD:protein FMN transferase